jgi:hypothetical protein
VFFLPKFETKKKISCELTLTVVINIFSFKNEPNILMWMVGNEVWAKSHYDKVDAYIFVNQVILFSKVKSNHIFLFGN